MPLDRTQWPHALLSEAHKSAWTITKVYPGSPAAALGLQEGWQLMHINGTAPTDESVQRARLEGVASLVFHTGEDCEMAELRGGLWPNGMKLSPGINAALKTAVRTGEVDPMVLHRIWSEETWQSFAALVPDFEMALLPIASRLTAPFTSKAKKHAKRLQARNYIYQQLLALAYLAADRKVEAREMLQAAAQNYEADGKPPMPNAYFALNLFVECLLHYHGGDVPKAKELAQFAVQNCAELPAICDLYSAVCRERAVIAWGPTLQKPFPIRYRLPRKDVHGFFDAPGQMCDLDQTLSQMKPGQLLLVYALGPYRMNGPFLAELVGLRSLYARFPERFAGVHVISERPDASAHWQHASELEEAIGDTDMPYQVAQDLDGSLQEALQFDSCPSLYVLNHEGIVLANGTMGDELAFWQALQRGADPEFLAAVPN